MTDVSQNPERPTDEWVTGDEPMTGPQQSYLRTLAQEAGEDAPPDDLTKAAEGDVDADAVRAGLTAAGIKLTDADFAGLLTEAIQHATRITARAATAEQLDELKVPRLELPTIADGVDLGSLYELSESLAQQGVR